MPTYTRRRPEVKSWPTRVAPRNTAPFGAGLLSTPIPPLPTPDPLPMPPRACQGAQQVRWHAVELEPLAGERMEPEPCLTLSGSWAMPGEDWSWELGFAE